MSFVFCANIKPRSIVVYPYFYEKKARRKSPHTLQIVNRDKGMSGTNKSRARLRTAIDLLCYTAKWKTVFVKKNETYFRYKLNFITLTLPSEQQHTDKEIIAKCLSPFLEAWAKRRAGLLYVYRAEVQDNGNIHFHVISNAFYHYEKLRRDWNRYVEKLGYVSRGTTENPNSTDVHALSNKGDVALYLTSYLSKKDLYTKTLKKYHSIFKKKLREHQENVFHLPKKYFKNIKRKVQTNLWNASQVLKGFKATSQYDADSISWKMLQILKEQKAFVQHDFAESLHYEVNGFEEFPEFKKLVDEQLKKVSEIQKKNVINEVINEI